MRLRGNSRLPAVVLGVIVAIVLAGCGGAAYGSGGGLTPTPVSGGAGGTGTSVTIQDYAFSPQTLTVKVGDTVTWVNKDAAPHTVTAVGSSALDATPTGLFDAQLSEGQTFSFTFDKAGTYEYECTIHKSMQSMHATVVVK